MIKRSIDVVGALVALIVLLPLIAGAALAVRLSMGGPIFFRQNRPGLHGKPFQMIKFRTMSENRDETGQLLSDAERLTAVGRVLRASSIDELPELWNVIKGEMSLVGPRPLLMKYLSIYTPEQARRHEIRPGLTGWAQINGRNAISWDEKFALDLWYVENRSTLLDVRILWITVLQVVRRQGINSNEAVTMPEFTGQEDRR